MGTTVLHINDEQVEKNNKGSPKGNLCSRNSHNFHYYFPLNMNMAGELSTVLEYGLEPYKSIVPVFILCIESGHCFDRYVCIFPNGK